MKVISYVLLNNKIMYYIEKWIDNQLYCKTSPDGKWQLKKYTDYKIPRKNIELVVTVNNNARNQNV